MSDTSLQVKDASGVTRALAADASGDVLTPKHIVASSALPDGAATAANQDTANSALAAMAARLLAGIQLLGDDAAAVLGSAGDIGYAGSDPATDKPSLMALAMGILARLSGTLTAKPSSDQDPVFDHANGVKLAVTTVATLITPPAGCKWIRISTDADACIRTDGSNAADDGGSIRIYAGAPEVIPVTAGTAVKAIAISGTANIRATPLKERS